MPFLLTWHPSEQRPPGPIDVRAALADTEAWWRDWSSRCEPGGPWREQVQRSLITLKALTYGKTGGIVAAPTTSLPEQLGGVRNWDYRYCWLRDATLTLLALLVGLHRRGARVARLAAARGGGLAVGHADHVRAGRRAAADRDRARLAARVRGSGAGADRQRRLGAVPARRLRRADGRAPAGARGRARAGPVRVEAAARAARLRRGGVDAARRGHLGGPRQAPALRALEGDGVGGVRPGGEDRREVRHGRRPSIAGGAARPHPRRGVRARLGRRAAHVHAVLRLASRWTRRCS